MPGFFILLKAGVLVYAFVFKLNQCMCAHNATEKYTALATGQAHQAGNKFQP